MFIKGSSNFFFILLEKTSREGTGKEKCKNCLFYIKVLNL